MSETPSEQPLVTRQPGRNSRLNATDGRSDRGSSASASPKRVDEVTS